MALPATGVWEVETTGNDNNGGMFDPSVAGAGTDYTYGAGQAAFAYTDLVVDSVTNTKVTSVSRAFVAADVGNTIQIVSGTGWTTGFYNIRSVAGGAATLDRSPAAVATTGGTGTLGGALASPGKAAGAAVGGNKVWIKSGTYTVANGTANTSGNKVSLSVGSSGASAMVWSGYGTTRGDLGTKPILAAGASSMTIAATVGGSNTIVFDNIEFNGSGFTSVIGLSLQSNEQIARRCKFNSISGTSFTGVSTCEAQDCEFTSGAGTALSSCAGNHINCVFHDSTVGCTSNGQYDGCVFYNLTGASTDAIADAASGWGPRYRRNTFYNIGRHAISLNSGTAFASVIENNIFYTIGGYAITFNGSGHNGAFIRANAYGALTSGQLDIGATVAGQTSAVNLTASPFTNAASGDFSLNTTAGGGALCRAAGIPGVFPGGLTTGYLDIGAAQHQDAGAGGGVALRSPIMANTLIYEE